MKLVDLHPKWIGSGGEGITHDGKPVPRREGIGLSFDCPCGCGTRPFVYLVNPLDGGPPIEEQRGWQRTGDTFENLTLSPSLLRQDPDGCRWHGFIRNGEIINA